MFGDVFGKHYFSDESRMRNAQHLNSSDIDVDNRGLRRSSIISLDLEIRSRDYEMSGQQHSVIPHLSCTGDDKSTL